MIKIVYLVSTLRRCGPTNQLLNIIGNLDRTTFNPVIITLSTEPEDSMKMDFQNLNIEIRSLMLGRLEGALKGHSKLKILLAEISPDIIHTQGLRPDLMGVRLVDYPVVSTIRNDPYVDYPLKYGFFRGKWMARLHMNSIRRSIHPVACSASLAMDFRKKYHIITDFISNGVNDKVYCPVNKKVKENLRKKLNMNVDQTVFIMIGSLIPRKNTETAIKSFLAADIDANLYIVGDGPLLTFLKEKYIDNESVIFTGQKANIPEYLKAADYFISSSTGEGLPNTVLEAMACGLTVVLSDIASHREIFEGTDYQYFFQARDVSKLRQFISELNNDGYNKYGKLVRDIVEQGFSANKMSDKYQKLYKAILK